MVQDRQVSAREFQHLLRDAEASGRCPLQFRRFTVIGNLELEARTFAKGLRLRDIRFEGRVTFRGCTFCDEVLSLDCDFRGGLDFSGSTFAASATLIGGSIGVENVPTDNLLFVTSFCSVRGNVELAHVKVYGACDARSTIVDGNFRLYSVTLSVVGRDRPPLSLAYAEIKGDLILGGLFGHFEADRLLQSMTMQGSFYRASGREWKAAWQQTTISYIDADSHMDVALQYMTVTGVLSLMQLRCERSISCLNSRFGQVDLSLAEIGGDLTLSGVTTTSIAGQGLRLDGTLWMIAGTSGQIHIDDYLWNKGWRTARIGALICSAWACNHWARFGLLSIGGNLPSKLRSDRRGVTIINCRFEDDLKLVRAASRDLDLDVLASFAEWQLGLAAERWGSEVTLGDGVLVNEDVVVDGDVHITDCTINGDLDLTRVRTTGSIDLSGCQVRKEIRFASPLSTLVNGEPLSDIARSVTELRYLMRDQDLDTNVVDSAFAWARSLNLRRVQAGSVDLTGLTLADGDIEAGEGKVDASHATVQRDLFVSLRAKQVSHASDLYERLQLNQRLFLGPTPPLRILVTSAFRFFSNKHFPQGLEGRSPAEEELIKLIDSYRESEEAAKQPDKWREASAKIPGALNLSDTKIGHLRLSSTSFEPDDEDKKAESAPVELCGIIFENAKLGELCIYRPLESKSKKGNGFPRPVNVRGIQVSSWRLGKDPKADARGASEVDVSGEPGEALDSAPYLDLLDNDKEYRASIYLAVEKALRDRGQDRSAREIYIAGVYRNNRTGLRQGVSRHWKWKPGDGRILQKRPPWSRQFARLSRPAGEDLRTACNAFLVILGVVVLVAVLAYPAVPGQIRLVVGLIALLLVLVLCMLPTVRWRLRRLFDRLYWTLLDYGTSAWRLLLVIVALAAVSFIGVAQIAENFEPKAEPAIAARYVPGFDVVCTKTAPEWGYSQAFWMTLRYHVPLVSLGPLDDCQASDGPLRLWFVSDSGEPPGWWKRVFGGWWLSASDWFGLMSILNYILWPLFIPFLIRKILREDRPG